MLCFNFYERYIKKKGLVASLKEAFPEKDWPSLDFSNITGPSPASQHLLKLLLER